MKLPPEARLPLINRPLPQITQLLIALRIEAMPYHEAFSLQIQPRPVEPGIL